MSDSLVDAVRDRLEEGRSPRQGAVRIGGMEAVGHELTPLTLGDLIAVGQAREAAGHGRGHEQGLQWGRSMGLEDGRREAREIVSAMTDALLRQMGTVERLLAAPDHGRDRQPKDEIRKLAVEQIGGVRFALHSLRAAHQEGVFDAD